MSDQGVARARGHIHRRLEEEERRGSQAGEEQGLLEEERRETARRERKQASDERVERISSPTETVYEPLMETYAVGHGLLPLFPIFRFGLLLTFSYRASRTQIVLR